MKFFYKLFLSIQTMLTILLSLCVPLQTNIIHAAEKRYCDTYYSDGGQSVYVTETLNYDYYVNTEMVFTELEPPKYDAYYMPNSCAPTAGGIAVGYYDFYHSNLIPNFDTYYYEDDYWNPKAKGSEMSAVMGSLYTSMGTNVGGDGTTISGFLSGLSGYVTNQGYTLTTTNIGVSSTIFSNCSTAFNNNEIVVLFLDSYEYINYSHLQINNTSYTFTVKTKQAGHVVIATGYRQYKFYQNNQLIETDNFFEVAFGNGTWGFLKANNLSTIDAAYKLSIS